MRLRRLAAGAALLSILVSPAAARAGECWYPKEAQAAQIRALHLMLMVGTLQCRQRSPRATQFFNDFVRDQGDVLVANNEVLKGRFMRESGVSAWQKDLDTFSTSLANLYSGRLDDGGYCSMIERTAYDAGDANYAQLLRMSESFADAPVSGACEVQVHRSIDRTPKIAISDALRRPAAPALVAQAAVAEATVVEAEIVAPTVATIVEAEPPVEVAEVDLAQAEADAQSAVVLAAVAESEAEAAKEVEVAAVEVAAVEVAAVEAPTRDDALRAAVAALQSAVVALQAVSVPGTK